MPADERLTKIEKDIEEIKDYQKKLEGGTKKGFSDVLDLIGRHTVLITDLEKNVINSDEAIIQLSDKLTELQRWKSEMVGILDSISYIEKKMMNTMEKIQRRTSPGF